MNGFEVGGTGNPSTKLSEYEVMEKKFNVFGQSVNGEIEIVIQVAHKMKYDGGIEKPILFGLATNISNYTDKFIIYDGIIVAGCFVISLIFLLNSLMKRLFSEELFFALYCFSQGIYAATQNEKIILIIFPNMDIEILWSCQFISLHLAVIFLVLFSTHLYNELIYRYSKYFVIGLLLIAGYLLGGDRIILNKLIEISPLLFLLIPVISIASGLLLVIITLIKGIKQNKDDAIELLLSIVAFICYGLSIGLEFLYDVDMGYWPPMMLIILMFTLAYFISNRNEKADKKVKQLTQELLVQNNVQDELIVKISQEINKPIHDLIESAGVLMDGTIGPLKAKQQEAVFSINSAVNKLKRIINEFLSARQKHQLKFTVKPTSLSLLEELNYEIYFFQKNTEKVQIKFQYPSDLPLILADRKRLKQALFNVLHNSVKYTKQGEIILQAYQKGKYVYITVEDTGIGIEDNNLKKIFTPFYQVPNPQNEEEGLGIGLSIAEQYVKMMDGDFSIESQINKGTKVTVLLPIFENQILKEVATTNHTIQNEFPLYLEGTREETILIINQNQEELTHLATLISENDFNVYAILDNKDVFQLISNVSLDLIVIDSYLKKEFILSLIDTIRKNYQITELPIILLSNTEKLEDVTVLFKHGVNAILHKPIKNEEFMSNIHSLFTMKKAVETSIKQELNYYHAQITPHFLYNTLNSIIGLSYIDGDKAREALEHLSVYFRAKLDFQKQQSLVSIEEEIELIEAYLAIEQLRFDHLQVELNIDPNIDCEIPSLTLQTLVENAINHGLRFKKEDAKLRIGIRQVGDYVQIEIEDNGVGMSPEQQSKLLKGQSNRLGFLNPFNKIRLFKNSKFELDSKEGEGTKITIFLQNKMPPKEC